MHAYRALHILDPFVDDGEIAHACAAPPHALAQTLSARASTEPRARVSPREGIRACVRGGKRSFG